MRSLLPELPLVEVPVAGAAPEVSGADLPYEVSTGAPVVLGHAAFAGVVGETAQLRPGVEGEDGVGGQGAEAHRRDVEQGHVVRLGAAGSADPDPGRIGAYRVRGHGRREVFAAGPEEVELGAERLLCVGALGPLVDDAAGVAVEGAAVDVPLDEVLLDLRPQRLQSEPEMTQQGVVPQDGMPALQEVVRGHQDEQQ